MAPLAAGVQTPWAIGRVCMTTKESESFSSVHELSRRRCDTVPPPSYRLAAVIPSRPRTASRPPSHRLGPRHLARCSLFAGLVGSSEAAVRSTCNRPMFSRRWLFVRDMQLGPFRGLVVRAHVSWLVPDYGGAACETTGRFHVEPSWVCPRPRPPAVGFRPNCCIRCCGGVTAGSHLVLIAQDRGSRGIVGDVGIAGSAVTSRSAASAHSRQRSGVP